MNNAYIANATLSAIDTAIKQDGGNKYRERLRVNIAKAEDAYRSDDCPFRSHLGASVIGSECARSIWYSFRWATLPTFDGRMIRLFNRGHLEEARIISALECIGVIVHSKDSEGNQYKFLDHNGHFGGSLDGVATGLPELQEGQPCLLEFKTHGEKSFKTLKDDGVIEAKPEHYVQMQIYMHKFGLACALYIAVNKNTDELYGEYVAYNDSVANQYLDRAQKIIDLREPPPKLNESAGWWKCKFCQHYAICHKGAELHVSCRTCKQCVPSENGDWVCMRDGMQILNKEDILKACEHYNAIA